MFIYIPIGFILFSLVFRMVNSAQFFKILIEFNESCGLITYKMHNFRYNKQSESIECTTITTSYQTNKRIAIIFKHTCNGYDDVAFVIYKKIWSEVAAKIHSTQIQ